MSQITKIDNCEICSSIVVSPNKLTCSIECRKIRKSNYDRIRNEGLAEQNVNRVREYRKGRGNERWLKDKEIIKNNPMRYYYKTILTLLSKYLRKDLNPKHSKTISMLPFEYSELRDKLISNIPAGYTWNDYVTGALQLDHKKPHSLFTYSHHTDEQFKECWSLDNLRLLPKHINISRQNKYE